MEEVGNKKLNLKVVSNSEPKKDSKLSYDDLNDLFGKARTQINQMEAYIDQLHNQIKQMSDVIQSQRLNYLFKVLEFSNVIKDTEFITSCVDEIKEALIIPEENVKEKKN